MSYRKHGRYSKKMKAMREARERQRLEAPAPDYPAILPEIRRRITVEDFDFGHVTHTLELHNTGRIDCYDVYADGVLWKRNIGWTRILEGLRKSMPRVGSSLL